MKFTENNPAEYITYDKDKDRYMLRYNNEIIKNKILKEKLGDKKEKNFRNFVPHKKIEYKNKRIIIYMTEDLMILILKINIVNIKMIFHYMISVIMIMVDFILKNLSVKKYFIKMLLHTNSVFSNKFKDDIAKILDELTNNGQLIIIHYFFKYIFLIIIRNS